MSEIGVIGVTGRSSEHSTSSIGLSSLELTFVCPQLLDVETCTL